MTAFLLRSSPNGLRSCAPEGTRLVMKPYSRDQSGGAILAVVLVDGGKRRLGNFADGEQLAPRRVLQARRIGLHFLL